MSLAGEVRATVLALRSAAPQRAGIAMRTMACVTLPLAIGVAAGHPRSGATASFGGLAGLYVPQSPYRYRARVVAAVGAGLAIAVLIGSTAGSRTWVAAMVTGVVAAAASFVCQAAELPPPRELMLIMVLLAATAVPAGLAGAAQRAGLAAAGALLAWLVTMSPALGRRRRLPERRAVDGALAAVAALLDAVGTGQASRGPSLRSRERAQGTRDALYLDGADDPDRAEDGTPMLDDDFLVLVNAWWEPLDFVLPATRADAAWQVELDSYDPTRAVAGQHAGDRLTVCPRSIVVLSSPVGPR